MTLAENLDKVLSCDMTEMFEQRGAHVPRFRKPGLLLREATHCTTYPCIPLFHRRKPCVFLARLEHFLIRFEKVQAKLREQVASEVDCVDAKRRAVDVKTFRLIFEVLRELVP